VRDGVASAGATGCEPRPVRPPARRALLVARLSLALAPSPSRALRRRNNRIDVFFQRRFGRSLSSLVSGLPMLLLTTRGRRSGLPRTVALAYAEIDGALIVAGGDHGSDRDPHWVLNLAAEPAVEVEVGRRRSAARAEIVSGAQRDALWTRVATQLPTVALYRERTAREIPLVRLER
jgi:deazaflavin-dependent oxidoreductase (nitroreductase family)